ncbi:multiple sugar transport system permease protein [Constrictibacter sp. MBR-5]|uniref:carbohydrate ABC transporter permease n=1 Tax=Constrictibacter sp. MBR-5 TaxID=3156467 RepID=UPI00339A3CEF
MNARRNPGFAVLRHVLLLAGAAFMLAPFAWMISTSLKPPGEIFLDHIRWWPNDLHVVENYTAAFTRAPLLRFMLNGVIVTATIFALQVAVALPCAYALAKLRFRARPVLFGAVLFCLLIPPHAISVPLFLLFHQIGILNSYAAMVVPFTISVFGIFLMRQFFLTVPDDLIDAARMDGISEMGIVWRVMLPTAIPALTAFGIFSVVAHWNDYFWPLIVINSEHLLTPPLGVAAFRNQEAGTDFGPLMAAATVIIAPLVIAFLMVQRRFIEGIALTGMK